MVRDRLSIRAIEPVEPTDVLVGGTGRDWVGGSYCDDDLLDEGGGLPVATQVDPQDPAHAGGIAGPFEDVLVSGAGSDLVLSYSGDTDLLVPSRHPLAPHQAIPGR